MMVSVVLFKNYRMKKTVLFGLLVGFLLTVSIAFASGPIQYFSDVNDGDWYYDSVSELAGIGVLEGYSDGTYQPSNSVNRAEIAVILDRFYDYINYPSGEDWVSYENDYYSIMLPHGEFYAGELISPVCDASDDLGIDTGFSVTCANVDNAVEELIADMGDQFGTTRREVRKDIQVNGYDALLVTVTTTEYRSWEHNAVFIIDETDGMTYMISDAALNMYDDFEYFYSTFNLL